MKIEVVIPKNKSKLLNLIFVCIIFFEPLAVNSLPEYNSLNSIWEFVGVLVFLVLAAKILFYHRVSYMLTSVILCHAVFFFSMFVHEALFYGLAILIILYSVFVVFKPAGLEYDRVYYNGACSLTRKNGLTKFFFPAVIFGIMCCKFNSQKYKRRAIGIAGLCLMLSIVVHTTTTMIGLTVCISLFCLSKSGGEKLRNSHLMLIE